jgi:hypothetical protein
MVLKNIQAILWNDELMFVSQELNGEKCIG